MSPNTASAARIYDYYLGGKDNFEADREAAERLLTVIPEAQITARANREFLVRAVRCLAGLGIDQYIDLGAGIPTSPNVHEIARESVPGAHVVYLDNDPVVVTHNRALRSTHDGVVSIDMDVRDSAEVRDHPEVRGLIDFSRPVGVLLLSVLQFFDDRDARKIIDGIRSWMVPGSYLALSTGEIEGSTVKRREADKIYAHAGTRAVNRSRGEIMKVFEDFELVPPGLTPISKWRADGPEIHGIIFLGGIGKLTGQVGLA